MVRERSQGIKSVKGYIFRREVPDSDHTERLRPRAGRGDGALWGRSGGSVVGPILLGMMSAVREYVSKRHALITILFEAMLFYYHVLK